jgi:CheY-like chemotaxis protein
VSSTIKILIVDDNPTILKLMCQSLEKCGEVTTAGDGADALMKAIESKPDLIISDYSMPVMDGRALFDKLRARKETQSIPFVFLASQKETVVWNPACAAASRFPAITAS